MSNILISVDYDKLTQEQKDTLETMFGNGSVVKTDCRSEFIEKCISELVGKNKEYPELYGDAEIMESVEKDMRQLLSKYLDEFICKTAMKEQWDELVTINTVVEEYVDLALSEGVLQEVG